MLLRRCFHVLKCSFNRCPPKRDKENEPLARRRDLSEGLTIRLSVPGSVIVSAEAKWGKV
jgi:hypothetical protein